MFARSFWERYLETFDGVCIVGRARTLDEPPDGWQRVDGPDISLAALPFFIGPREYAAAWRRIRRASRGVARRGDAILGRAPGRETNLLLGALPSRGYPFGLEIVNDPYDLFAPGCVRHPTRPLFRWWDTRTLRRQCAAACAAAYVTEHALQQRYPPAPGAYSASYSSIELPDAAFAAAPRAVRSGVKRFRVVAVGSLSQMHKGMDVLIDAVGHLVQHGFPVELRIVGGGRHRGDLETHARRRNAHHVVSFVGELPSGAPVRRELDAADLFVLASRAEGLPRILVEAMARGLPCIGTRVGGVPELLDEFAIVPSGDAYALAQKLRTCLTASDWLRASAARNLVTARAYRDAALQPKRVAFYRELEARTREWLQGTAA